MAGWLVTPLAWFAFAAGCCFLAWLGPVALLVLPAAVLPLAFVFLQARYGTRLLRGRADAARPLFAISAVGAVLLSAAAVIAMPGPTLDPRGLDQISPAVLAGILVLTGGALLETVAAVLLWPAVGAPRVDRQRRIVGTGLAALAAVQLVVLTSARPG